MGNVSINIFCNVATIYIGFDVMCWYHILRTLSVPAALFGINAIIFIRASLLCMMVATYSLVDTLLSWFNRNMQDKLLTSFHTYIPSKMQNKCHNNAEQRYLSSFIPNTNLEIDPMSIVIWFVAKWLKACSILVFGFSLLWHRAWRSISPYHFFRGTANYGDVQAAKRSGLTWLTITWPGTN